MSENLSPVTAETSTDEDDIDSSKSKSKKKALGAFVVESKPPKKSEEKVVAVQQLAAARRAEVAAEVETPATETELAAATAFLAAAEVLGDNEAAYQQIVAELEAPLEILNDNQEIDTVEPHEGEIELHNSQSEAAAKDDEAEPTPTVPPTATASSAATPMLAGASGNTTPPPSGPGGSGGQPPSGNRPSGPNSPSGPTGLAGPNYNALPPAPVTTAEASVPLDAARANERRALADGLIVGGIVGYLYGRRRGRIKTEKRLAPVQRQLEKQVKSLQTELLQTETTVRQRARKLQQERPLVAARITERLQRTARQEAIKRPERPLSYAPVPPERIGQVLVAASAAAGAERLKPVAKTSNQEAQTAKKRAETMSRGELLALSETVQVDGTSLRQIYEAQLVSEKGLRRLVTEHLRGGNVARALRRELVEHEIDFERDPILRDRGNSDGNASVSGTGKTALSGLLAQAGVSDQAQTEPIGPAPKKRQAKTEKAAAKAQKRQQSVVDGALVTIIIVLIFVIIAVLMRSR